MSNLLQETIACIADSGHKPEDIVFIGSEKSGHSCTWDEFIELANKDYDSGCGGPEVCTDLIIVFSDGQKMWRGEDAGSEWWEFSNPFTKPSKLKPIKTLFANHLGWEDLEEANK